MKTKMATNEILCCSLNQTADSRWKHICRAYAATLSVAPLTLACKQLECFELL